MKLARVIHQGRAHLALVDEENQAVDLVGGLLARDLNPVRAVIERRIGEQEL